MTTIARVSSIGKVYASAFLSVAKERKIRDEDLDQIQVQMDSLGGSLDQSRALQQIFSGKLGRKEERQAVVTELAKLLNANELLMNFLKLLVEKDRILDLREISVALRRVRLEQSGGIYGEVASSDLLSPEDLAGLEAAFGRRLGCQVKLESHIDPSLIAGLKVKVGGVTYDGSIAAQLRRARLVLAEVGTA